MVLLTYRPLKGNVHPHGGALGDGAGVHQGAACVPVGARRLRVNDALMMFEAYAEKDAAVAGLAADAERAAEGLDLQLEDRLWRLRENLRGGSLFKSFYKMKHVPLKVFPILQ